MMLREYEQTIIMM